jgi:hypothetical protein
LKSVFLTLQQHGPTSFSWSLSNDDLDAPLVSPEFTIDAEVNALARGFLSDPRADNAKRLSTTLGRAIVESTIGEYLRDQIAYTTASFVYLSIPEAVSHFPWELMKVSREGVPLCEGLPTSRITEGAEMSGVFINQCVLVSPNHHGVVRDRTLYSSTRRLARKETLEVVELDPPSSTSLRRSTRSGNLVIHFEGVRGDQVSLDDGVFSISDLALSKSTWLVVLGGTESSLIAAQELAKFGVVQSTARSFNVHPRTQAIFERSFYHALADGDCIGTAIFRARHSVAQSDAMLAFQAAAYVCTVTLGEALPDQQAFPPPQVRQPLTLDLNGELRVEKLRSPLQNLREVPAHPIPLSVFIQESIQVLRGSLESPRQRDARKAVLRRLAVRHTPGGELEVLPREPGQLRRFFEELVGVPDSGLNAVQGRSEQVKALSEFAGLTTNCAQGLVHAIRSHQILHLEAHDLRQARSLVRGVSESVYGYCPRFFSHRSESSFFDGPCLPQGGGYDAGGGFARTLASHWRRDETASLQPDQPRPSIRLPSLGRVGDAWHIFRGTWLVLEINEQWSTHDEQTIQRALDTRVFDGLNRNGKPFRLAVPKDFRVLLISSPASAARTTVASISLEASQTALSGHERWNTYLSDLFGPPSGLTEVQYRAQFLNAFARLFLWLQLEHPATIGQGERLLGTAYSIGGESQGALSKAVETLYGVGTRAHVTSLSSLKDLGSELTRLNELSPHTSQRQRLAAVELWTSLSGANQADAFEGLSHRECVTAIVKLTKNVSRSIKPSESMAPRV